MGKKLGTYIKSLRKEQKIPARVLSERTGISKSFIDYVENGLREPSAESLAKIAAALDVSLDTLINIQVEEQLDKAATAFEVSNADLENVSLDLRAAGRNRDNKSNVSEEALKKVKLALQGSSNKQAVLDIIQNADLRAIFRASDNLSDDDIAKIRKVMESLYPDAFKH
jgi:transcriptional regulator with XRE-family HTH domain